MKKSILALLLTVVAGANLMADAAFPDLTYDMIGKEADDLFNIENKALTTGLNQKGDIDNLKKDRLGKVVTLGGKEYSLQEAVFASTRHEKPVSLGEYLKSKGPGYVLKGKMKDGVCEYFLTTVLEFDLLAK